MNRIAKVQYIQLITGSWAVKPAPWSRSCTFNPPNASLRTIVVHADPNNGPCGCLSPRHSLIKSRYACSIS